MFSVILSLTSYVLVMHNSESICLTCFTLRVIFRSLMTISFNSNLFCLINIVMLTYNHVILTLIIFSFDLPLCIFRPSSYVFALSGPLVVTLKQ